MHQISVFPECVLAVLDTLVALGKAMQELSPKNQSTTIGECMENLEISASEEALVHK